MNEHSERISTNTQEGSNLFVMGGLVIMMCFAAPVLILIAIAKGLSLFSSGSTTNK
jgi:hypothetical protein